MTSIVHRLQGTGETSVPLRVQRRRGLPLFLVAFFLAILVFVADWLHLPGENPLLEKHRESAQLMAQAMEVVKRLQMQMGIAPDPQDFNRTGLIGPEYTDMVTTLGRVTAKRTSTNPHFAGLVLDLLYRAGVRPGDTVAICFSGSFPALNLAVLAAARTLEVRPVIISSIGTSSYGASHPNLTWLDMEAAIAEAGLWPYRSVAGSLGGIVDSEGGLDGTGIELGRAAILRNKVPFLDEGNATNSLTLAQDIERRIAIYSKWGGKIAAFVNVGGNITSLGWIPEATRLGNGLLRKVPRAEAPDRGLIFRMHERGVPVIHLLNIEHLAAREGLPIDPVPLPAPDSADYTLNKRHRFWQTVVLLGLLLLIGGIFTWRTHRRNRSCPTPSIRRSRQFLM